MSINVVSGSGLRIEKRLQESTRPDMVQVAPNKWMPRNDSPVPDVTLASFVEQADGSYSCIPFQERMARLTPELLDKLGVGHGSRKTLQRLGRANFIEILRISPKCFVLNLDSYFNHLRRVAEDPWFWENEDNVSAYLETVGDV